MLPYLRLRLSSFRNILVKCMLVSLLCLLTVCDADNIVMDQHEEDIEAKWQNIGDRFKDVNALHISYISANGKILSYNKGININGGAVDENTIFEAASLSKMYFAYLYWKLLSENKISADPVPVKDCKTNNSISYSPYVFLSHTSPLTGGSCVGGNGSGGEFSYSEYGYLALQNNLEKTLGKTLEQICQEELAIPYNLKNTCFIWRPANDNYVNGYVKNNEFHREIHKYDTARANGTLYTNGKDLTAFVKLLMQSNMLDSMQLPVTNVPAYNHLFWGRGIGIEINNNKRYSWHWGSNWSFNNFVITNKSDKTAIVILTNSVSGRTAIKETVNWLTNTHLQAFDYLQWY